MIEVKRCVVCGRPIGIPRTWNATTCGKGICQITNRNRKKAARYKARKAERED